VNDLKQWGVGDVLNILQIAKKMPVPSKDGEALAILNFSKLLIELQAKLTLVAMSTQKHPGTLHNLPKNIKENVHHSEAIVNTNFKPQVFLKSFVNHLPYTLNRFYSKKFERLILDILQNQSFHLIQLEGLYLLPYVEAIRKKTQAKIVLRAHNIEHQVWKNLAKNTQQKLRQFAYQYNANSIQTIEEQLRNKVDAIITISSDDQSYFENQKNMPPIFNLPFGIDIQDYPVKINAQSLNTTPKTLCFIGSLDWLPNIEGIHWFLTKVWDKVLQNIPNAEFFIAGRNMQSSIKNIQMKNVHIMGEVKCAKTFMSEHPVFVVPLLSGSGMRIKIIEAMALQAAVVSTPLGASGIEYTHQQNIVIAEKAEVFAKSIIDFTELC